MAVKARRRRSRRNPVRGVGTLVLNPRRKRSRKSSRSGRRTNRSHRRRSTRRRSNSGARRGIAKYGFHRRRNTRRRRTSGRRRTNRGHSRRRSSRRRRNRSYGTLAINNPRRRRRNRRSGSRVVYRYRNGGRRRGHSRRRNPDMGGMLRKIPVIGGLLSTAAGFIGPTLAGILGVEPTMLAAKFLGQYVPAMNSSLFYVLVSLGLAAVAGTYLPINPATRKLIATGIASAGGGVAYYKWRTGQDGAMSGEMAGLPAYSGLLGDGGAYAVVPFGDAGDSLGEYAGTNVGDVLVSPAALSSLEVNAALSGLGAWRRTFGPVRSPMRRIGQRHQFRGRMPQGIPEPSEASEGEGHRFGWMIRLLGFDQFRAFAQLPPAEQQQAIHAARQCAIQAITANVANQPGVQEELAGLGAQIFAA